MKKVFFIIAIIFMCLQLAVSQEKQDAPPPADAAEKNTSAEEKPQKRDVEKEFHGKIGTSYAHDLDNWGLDISLNFYFKIDPYFAVGLEADFFWLPWEKKLGEEYIPATTQTKDVVADTNIYSIPLFFNAQVRLPVVAKYIYIEPFITGGIGWAMAIESYTRPEYESTSGKSYTRENVLNFYQGFTWQVFLTIAAKPHKESRIQFMFDIGFRGLAPQNIDNEILRISGLIMRLGVMVSI